MLDCAGKLLDLSAPAIMGVLNVTPDSFSDGGLFFSIDNALEHASLMVEQGAAIIDVGGESTRPGAVEVSVAEEIDRVIPVIEALATSLAVPVSIDTRKALVMQSAISAGAGLVNDISALSDSGSMAVVADAQVPVILMHMQGNPATMQLKPQYHDVVKEIVAYFSQRISRCAEAGIKPQNIIIDPGFGFGKSDQHNLELLANLQALSILQKPVLVGLSRKSMIGRLLNLETSQRMLPSVILALMAVERGAQIVRVHDVQETRDAIVLWQRIHDNEYQKEM
ncbi:MAG: dihydropteroate synthase [Gammaproteobacteria bacterium]